MNSLATKSRSIQCGMILLFTQCNLSCGYKLKKVGNLVKWLPENLPFFCQREINDVLFFVIASWPKSPFIRLEMFSCRIEDLVIERIDHPLSKSGEIGSTS